MFKALTPIFALLISIGLGVTYVQPTFVDIKDIETEADEYAKAIDQAEELKALIQQKIDQKNSFDPNDLEDLETMIPDSVNEVAMIMDIDALARANNMLLSEIRIAEAGKDTGGNSRVGRAIPNFTESIDPADQTGVSADEIPYYLSTDISFTVTGTYEGLREFVLGLEKSLVFTDVVKLSFGGDDDEEGDLTGYQMTIRTYAFNVEK